MSFVDADGGIGMQDSKRFARGEGGPLRPRSRTRREPLHVHRLNESEKTTWTARASPAAWGTLGELQQHFGYPAEAAVSTSLAHALAGDAAAVAAFETTLAALAKVKPEAPADFHSSIEAALEDQPDSALLKNLMARAAKLVPAEKTK